MLTKITSTIARMLQPMLEERNNHDYGIPLDDPGVTILVDETGVLVINVPNIPSRHDGEATYLFDGRKLDAWRHISI